MTRSPAPGRLAYWMRALGRHDLPDRLEVSDRTLRRLETAKHDFWAATGFYEDESGGRAVLKVYRAASYAGAPLRWLGRWDVDANKPENILVGDDGFPYLIDFQIACRCGPNADHALGRWWLARLQREDLYHALKHKRRCAREAMTSDELTSVRQRSVLIRLHRALKQPYRMVRRPLFRWLRRTGRVLSSGSN